MYYLNVLIPAALIGIFYFVHLVFTGRQNRARQKKLQHDFLQSQIEIQEQTFARISADIHDNISLTLSLSKIYLHDLDYNDPRDVSDKISLSVNLIKKAMEDLNNLARALNPETFEKFGLIKSIEEQVNNLCNAELFQIKYNVTGIPRSAGINNELILFRMIQEALNNIIKHANATHVTITLDYKKCSLTARIRDNGSGFDPGVQLVSNGCGLSNMRKRAGIINARLLIDSKPQNGTSIKILLPLNANN
ncbi:MAG TPA: ATP-binding protein [Flavitalea sp.]|nr:ATP-binding protein [Flavitalea sp.]